MIKTKLRTRMTAKPVSIYRKEINCIVLEEQKFTYGLSAEAKSNFVY